jgi:hypothetical protein
MSDEEIMAFLEHYNHNIPDPIHEPKRFAMFVKMWRYYNDTQQNKSTHSPME